MNTRSIGTKWEQKAADYLKEQGYSIIEMNFRCRVGEIDIVARDGKYLVFAEVKYRAGAGSGSAASAVSPKKQHRISRTVLFYMARHKIPETQAVRFDVVAVNGGKIDLIRNAFDFC